MWILKFNYFSKRLVRGPKFLKFLFYMVLIPIWWVGQVIAPFLDRLDNNWTSETIGYYVTAKRLSKSAKTEKVNYN